jgi:hypothetical protein
MNPISVNQVSKLIADELCIPPNNVRVIQDILRNNPIDLDIQDNLAGINNDFPIEIGDEVYFFSCNDIDKSNYYTIIEIDYQKKFVLLKTENVNRIRAFFCQIAPYPDPCFEPDSYVVEKLTDEADVFYG